MSVVDVNTPPVVPAAKRDAPWRRLGERIEGALTVQEALDASGLNWEVEKKPIWHEVPFSTVPENVPDGCAVKLDNDTALVQLPNRFKIQRSTDLAVLGIVGTDYEPFQNAQALQFITDLIDTGEVEWDTMGELRGGKWVWAALKLPGNIVIAGDEIGRNLIISTSHDGSKAITAFTSHIRIICENTLRMALNAAHTSWSIRHIGSLEGRLEEARRSLQLVHKHDEEFIKLMDGLASQKFDEGAYERLIEQLIPKQHRVQDRFKELYQTTTTVQTEIKGTKYGALQVIAEGLDWGRGEDRDAHAQVMSTWVGNSFRLRNKALKLLVEAA